MAPSRGTIIQIMMVSYRLFFEKFCTSRDCLNFASWLLGSASRNRRSEKNQTESSENQESLENLEFPVYGLETTEFSDPQTDEGSR